MIVTFNTLRVKGRAKCVKTFPTHGVKETLNLYVLFRKQQKTVETSVKRIIQAIPQNGWKGVLVGWLLKINLN